MTRLLKEALRKDVLIIVIIGVTNLWLWSSNPKISQTETATVVTIIGLILAGALTGNFVFAYGKVNLNSLFDRLLAHFTSGFLMLCIGILLSLGLYFLKSVGSTGAFFWTVIIAGSCLFVSIILFDIWDANRYS